LGGGGGREGIVKGTKYIYKKSTTVYVTSLEF
jgi:hypothetical protein